MRKLIKMFFCGPKTRRARTKINSRAKKARNIVRSLNAYRNKSLQELYKDRDIAKNELEEAQSSYSLSFVESSSGDPVENLALIDSTKLELEIINKTIMEKSFPSTTCMTAS